MSNTLHEKTLWCTYNTALIIVDTVANSKFTENVLRLYSGSAVFSGKETVDDDNRR